MKYLVITSMVVMGLVSGLQAQDEPVPPAQVEFPVEDEPVIIQSFAAPLAGGFGGEGGVITLQTTGDAFAGGGAGGVLRAISPMLGGLGFMSRDQMLMRKDVQEDIALESEQVDAIKKLQQDYQKKMRSTIEGMRDVNRQQRGAFMREFTETNRVNFEKDLEKVLHPPQLNRLKEIQFQSKIDSRGGNALFDPAVAKALGITEEQRKELMVKSQAAQKELNEKIQAMRKGMQEKLLQDVLTEDQVKMIEKLSGQKFEQQKRSSFQVLPSGVSPRP